MKGLFSILGGLGVGAALMYLFDPQEGNRRRALIRDKANSINHKAQGAITGSAQQVANRAKGLLHESGSTFGRNSSRNASDDLTSEQQTIQ